MSRRRNLPMSPRAAWGGIALLALLATLLLGSLVCAVGSLVGLLSPDPRQRELVEGGLVAADSRVVAIHAFDDGTASCVLLDDAILATRDGRETGRLALVEAEMVVSERPLQVTFTAGEQTVACPFRADGGIDTFAALARQATARQRGRGWRPVDPRVRDLLDREAPPR